MTTLEQLESDEREAWKAWSDYDNAGKPLRDKWHEIHAKLTREKLKAEILAEQALKRNNFMEKYILDENGKPKPEPDLIKWGQFMQDADRKVARTKFPNCEVSTVFLGLNHSFDKNSPPLIWETMIFGGEHDQYEDHCSGDREQAEAMHKKACELVK